MVEWISSSLLLECFCRDTGHMYLPWGLVSTGMEKVSVFLQGLEADHHWRERRVRMQIFVEKEGKFNVQKAVLVSAPREKLEKKKC